MHAAGGFGESARLRGEVIVAQSIAWGFAAGTAAAAVAIAKYNGTLTDQMRWPVELDSVTYEVDIDFTNRVWTATVGCQTAFRGNARGRWPRRRDGAPARCPGRGHRDAVSPRPGFVCSRPSHARRAPPSEIVRRGVRQGRMLA